MAGIILKKISGLKMACCLLTPDTRLRGRSRFDAAKARNLTPAEG
jgi:hypothetical protein